jgi:phosphohistidine phosphatase SixA
MKLVNFLIFIFISLTLSIKAEISENLLKELKVGNKLIFIRHAYAPGTGDPNNFDLKNCKTQRNLNDIGKEQATRIGDFFLRNKISIGNVFSSEWCRCKETTLIAFKKFESKDFLNSFYNAKFAKNKKKQIKNFKKFIKELDDTNNIIFVTHYVNIYEILNYSTMSGEIVISDKKFNVIDSIKIYY